MTELWIYIASMIVCGLTATLISNVLEEELSQLDVNIPQVLRIIALVPILNTVIAALAIKAIVSDLFCNYFKRK